MFSDELELYHTGVGHDDNPPGRGSGRYGWGTGENPGQHQFTFLSEVKTLKQRGIKDAEIAKILLGEYANTTNLRAEIAIQTKKERQINRARAIELLDECNGNVSEVARRMNKNESSIRSLLDPIKAERTNKYENTAEMLKKRIEKSPSGIIDVSKATEYTLGVTDSTKKVAIAMLEKEGYVKSWVQVPQMGTDHKTSIMVLAKMEEGETPKDTFARIQKNKFNISPIQDYTPDEGKKWWTPEFPESMDSKRILIRYAEDGGKLKDGVIEINPDAIDLSLEGSRYAQVRIAVDGTNYMKGMAIYGDKNDFPKGIDVIYNTNKHVGIPAIDKNSVYNPETDSWSGKEVLKRMKIDQKTMEVDQDNPFGALIRAPKEMDGILTAGGQHKYIGSDGKEHLSPINKLQDEGDWDSWSRNLSTQFLSKQPLKLINQQISISLADKHAELDEILRLTNPVIKKKLLEEFAAGCDSNAADLSVKGFKNQAFQVLLPIPGMKDNEIYAPNYKDGDTVALVRYPHGGLFEIPILKVNNKQEDAKRIMNRASDAVGINNTVAEQLSGADFDGDTALVIPLTSNKISVKSRPYFEELKNFDAKEIYKLPDDAPKMKNRTKQNEMGRVTNLITDMTVQGATEKEIVRAVKHSMVVIDAEKHHLDYKQSAIDNNISQLKDKYQKRVDPDTGKETSGASTIFSKSSAKVRVDQRKEVTDTSKMTPEELERWNKGQIVWRPTNEKIVERVTDPEKMTSEELSQYNAGKKVYRTTNKNKQTEVYRMDTVDDATDLVRNTNDPKEMAYANYANELKDMANQARKESRSITSYPVSQEAKKTYSNEVESLNQKLRIAESNAPRERQAQVIANSITSEKFASNPDMDYEHRQRERSRALTQARAMVGAKKEQIEITDEEWDAIQAGAISFSKLTRILNNTDQDAFKKRATPRISEGLTSSQISLIKEMSNSGMYTQKEIADRLGISVSSVSSYLRNE